MRSLGSETAQVGEQAQLLPREDQLCERQRAIQRFRVFAEKPT